MGSVQPIQISSIIEYCDMQGITEKNEICHVIDMIQAIDRAYIEEINQDNGES